MCSNLIQPLYQGSSPYSADLTVIFFSLVSNLCTVSDSFSSLVILLVLLTDLGFARKVFNYYCIIFSKK